MFHLAPCSSTGGVQKAYNTTGGTDTHKCDVVCLPKRVATIAAARRSQPDIAFGSVVGSNIFNGLSILGATSLIHTIAVPASLAGSDTWCMTGVTAFLLLVAVTRWRINRAEGAVIPGVYDAYSLRSVSLDNS